jgi:hypothetical protein
MACGDSQDVRQGKEIIEPWDWSQNPGGELLVSVDRFTKKYYNCIRNKNTDIE